jgi:phosphatidylinositol glycan class K
MLFMIDTCQANTMFSKIYSPNIIATGSSALDQSSYSHHADNDVGVAVIDRYTYYNLDFLETHITPNSKQTLADLFDSYDEGKIHSTPAVRWDLFPGGESKGRERLVTDFFGNVQNVEIEDAASPRSVRDLQNDLIELRRMLERRNVTVAEGDDNDKKRTTVKLEQPAKESAKAKRAKKQGTPLVAMVKEEIAWNQKATGALALAGCAALWFLGSFV